MRRSALELFAISVLAVATVFGKGRRRVVAGRIAGSLVRVAALALVLVSSRKADAAGKKDDPPPAPTGTLTPMPTRSHAPVDPIEYRGEFPAAFPLRAWAEHREGRRGQSMWSAFKTLLARIESGDATALDDARSHSQGLPASFLDDVASRVDGFRDPKPVRLSNEKRASALDEMENEGYVDEWLSGWFWRGTKDYAQDASLAPLLARIENHSRLAHALLRAQERTGPVQFVPWMKKSSPPHGYEPFQAPADFVPIAAALFKQARAETWEAQSVLELTVLSGEPVLLRRGAKAALPPGTRIRLRRLDVLTGAASFENASLGVLTVGAGESLTAWTILEHLTKESRSALEKAVDSALGGDRAAQAHIEQDIVASQALIRAALAKKPGATGAPALRMILVGFDE